MEFIKHKSTIFVLDTNILLNMGRLPLHAGKHFLNLLKSVEDRIWIPRQVLEEFDNNKMHVFGDISNRYKKLKKELETRNSRFFEGIEKTLANPLDLNYLEAEELREEIKTKIDEIDKIISKFGSLEQAQIDKGNHEAFKKNLFEFVEKLRVGKEISMSERLRILSEGELRYTYQIPPGFKDEKKDKKGVNPQAKFGDLFLWKEILGLPEKRIFPNLTDIVFITNDQKQDWYLNNDIHPDLLKEFKENNSNINIHFMKGADFYRVCSKLNGSFEDDVFVEMYILQIIRENESNVVEEIEEALKKEMETYPTPFDGDEYKEFEINKYQVIKHSYINKEITVRYWIQLTIYSIGYDIEEVTNSLGNTKNMMFETEFSLNAKVLAEQKMMYNESNKQFENCGFKIEKVIMPEPDY